MHTHAHPSCSSTTDAASNFKSIGQTSQLDASFKVILRRSKQ
ncbi:hypothetical protein PVAP13_3NG213326 [Panicum virgatum]|uniref:Uncharacterized protein n=1 Tax=Panicum virgatum TaxID=38727 RepID=A0A8T0UJM2_PANVG|nr:hypothetical protein PVAP13_3NG213326 [Panicum virgatum]